MTAKIADMLKKNPLLLIFYLVYMAINITLVFLFLPNNFNQTDLVELLLVLVKLVVFGLATAVTGLLFLSGLGNMLSIAAAGEKASIASFAAGIKKYMLKLLLAGLLLIAITIAYSFALGLLLIPVILIISIGLSGDAAAANSSFSSLIGAATTIITILPALFLMPLIVLWFPAIFSDNLKVTEALRRGVRTGVKCYGRILIWTLITYLPTMIYMFVNPQQVNSGNIYTPAYYAVTAVSVILSFLYMCATFILYSEKSRGAYIA